LQVCLSSPLHKSSVASFCGRALECFIVLLLILVVAPLLVVIALLIKLDSPGPVLFRQIRLGLDGKPFALRKFRTMHVVSLEHSFAAQRTVRSDPRVTRVGRFLRLTSIDELPQLFDILRGDLALVGPIPLLPYEGRSLDAEIVRARSMYRPGLTGWAQIRGIRRGHISGYEYNLLLMQEIDYMRRRTLLSDLGILLKTLGIVFSMERKNVY
jgi:lipopolysaccharide/colanic/teichoic acid biosynthesis glycosyltransferase